MEVASIDGDPLLPEHIGRVPDFASIQELTPDVLIIGGGPAGLNAALELGNQGVTCLVLDDKERPGGKLVLQTHQFFGSIADCHAGTRGIHIAEKLFHKVEKLATVTCMFNTLVLGVFKDKRVGAATADTYYLITPKVLLSACGAREKALAFPGATLPGVYGAGAFQTLVNRDLVRTSKRIFVVGGGNVGLIAGYHAIQAGMTVVGVTEVMPKCSGYYVHSSKLQRLGVPIYTGHTVIAASGRDRVESVTIAQTDAGFNEVPGTRKTFACDTVLIAVGLSPVDEFHQQAQRFGLPAFSAGDAREIAEASAAMFGGKLAAMEILQHLGHPVTLLDEYKEKQRLLSLRPQACKPYRPEPADSPVFPMLHCVEEIPCNPCITVCPSNSLRLAQDRGDLLDTPLFDGPCVGCNKCVQICPGLAITLVDKRKTQPGFAAVTIPFEIIPAFAVGDRVPVVDIDGNLLEHGDVLAITDKKWQDSRLLVTVRVSENNAHRCVGIRVQDVNALKQPIEEPQIADDMIICRCEHVKAGEIRAMVRSGITDLNQLKALRVGMGACGGRTCYDLVMRLLRAEGVDTSALEKPKSRPLYSETPLAMFAGVKEITS